ncbi:MAG: 30S ribosomal protein S1 [Phototrophicales bacterium]|nr:MAG: 30S ribosomal protein S1 [Phototrophicales bacterium]
MAEHEKPSNNLSEAVTPEAETVEEVETLASEAENPSEAISQNTSVAVEQPTTSEDELTEDDEDVVGASENEHDDEEDNEASDTESATGLKRGLLLEGTIVSTSPTEIRVDLGEHGEGIINSRELERLTSATLETLKEGTNILVYVLNPSNSDGKAVLSISRALEESDWRKAEEYLESQQVYTGKVSGYNKGGLIVRFGRLRGFVPASQISAERRERAQGESPEERWGSMLGETIYVKVVELKRSRNRLILSEQAANREIREQRKTQLLNELQKGQVRKGVVTSLTDFGAFVDLGGADGLVHLTELSWTHVTHPSEVVEVGQEVEVEVISVDLEGRRIGLSMRRLGDDPWEQVVDQYKKGQLIQATVTKLTKFGAFARLVDHPEIEGLIHVSELSEHRVRHPREVVSKGDVLTLRIIKIDRDQRRLGLSLKQVDSPDYMDFDWDFNSGA